MTAVQVYNNIARNINPLLRVALCLLAAIIQLCGYPDFQ